MLWCAATLLAVAVMAGILGLADSGAAGAAAVSALFYVFVTLFFYAFFFILRPTRGRPGPLGRKPHSRHE
ncbi:MAG: hypothetical protein JWM88_256 [Verrucomicrobia bacterium]|nr:hypothetical protein [Verrucomicrobiota bacterium]